MLIGNRRGSTRIWGCVGGVAAYTPPNPGVITVNPNDPAQIGLDTYGMISMIAPFLVEFLYYPI